MVLEGRTAVIYGGGGAIGGAVARAAFGGYGDPMPGYHLGGLQVAFQAIEAFRRNLASSSVRTAFES